MKNKALTKTEKRIIFNDSLMQCGSQVICLIVHSRIVAKDKTLLN